MRRTNQSTTLGTISLERTASDFVSEMNIQEYGGSGGSRSYVDDQSNESSGESLTIDSLSVMYETLNPRRRVRVTGPKKVVKEVCPNCEFAKSDHVEI